MQVCDIDPDRRHSQTCMPVDRVPPEQSGERGLVVQRVQNDLLKRKRDRHILLYVDMGATSALAATAGLRMPQSELHEIVRESSRWPDASHSTPETTLRLWAR